MASRAVQKIAPEFEHVSGAPMVPKKAKKSKKPKKERKDKSGNKCVDKILLLGGGHDAATLTQIHESKKRKKAKKKKTRPEENVQLQPQIRKTKSVNQLKQRSSVHTGFTKHTNQIPPVICISPDELPKHSTASGCYRRVKEMEKGKIKKRVVFNLPPERSQATDTEDEDFSNRNVCNPATIFSGAVCSGKVSHGKQLAGNGMESQTTAEETNSQDLFITQKSFLDPNVDLSSSSSGNEMTSVSVQDNRSRRTTAEASTQTENFFTFSELSNSLRFQQQKTASMCTEEPVDLSLPNRARQSHGPNLSTKPAAEFANPFKLKTSDTSSEDGDMVPKTKGDLSQLKVIQTRLNESFFFKVKGYDSPKPVCPLMKLTESVEKKTKK